MIGPIEQTYMIARIKSPLQNMVFTDELLDHLGELYQVTRNRYGLTFYQWVCGMIAGDIVRTATNRNTGDDALDRVIKELREV